MQPTDIARHLVVNEFNTEINSSDAGKEIKFDDTYFYFFAYILGGWKVYVSTTVPDNKIYEVTHDTEKKRTYLDVYVKLQNRVIEDDVVGRLKGKLMCSNHNPVQHRDARPPWCKMCGLTADGSVPQSSLDIRRSEPEHPNESWRNARYQS